MTFPTQALLLVGQPLTNTVTFLAPTSTFSVLADASSTTADPVPGNNANTQPTTVPADNLAPLAQNVVNTLQAPEGSTAAAPLPIRPLVATDADGTIASYTIAALPPPTQGVLYVFNGTTNVLLNTTNFPGLVLTPAQASNLRFDPAGTFIGNVFFNYFATDNAGAASAPALYTIPVGQDNNSFYAATPPRGGNSNQYQNNDVLAFLIDPNGALYNGSGLIYNASTGAQQPGTSNGLAPTGTNALLTPTSGPGSVAGPASNPTNALPPGTSLNPATGQIFVSNAALLPRVGVATPYTVNITTTDVFGGVTTQPVTFILGAYPLPVELISFAAKAVRNVDGQLNWRTASERNNDHWNIERSLNGRDFVKFAEVAGQGTKPAPTDYALTDANAAKLGATVYYRLQQVDTDGTTAYSPVQSVTFSKSAQPVIALFPNPATASTTLDLSALPTGTYTVTLTDLAGRLVRSFTTDGGLSRTLDVQELATGSYLLTVTGQGPDALHLVKRLTKE